MHGEPPSGGGGAACPRRRTSLTTGVERAGGGEPSAALDRAGADRRGPRARRERARALRREEDPRGMCWMPAAAPSDASVAAPTRSSVSFSGVPWIWSVTRPSTPWASSSRTFSRSMPPALVGLVAEARQRQRLDGPEQLRARSCAAGTPARRPLSAPPAPCGSRRGAGASPPR